MQGHLDTETGEGAQEGGGRQAWGMRHAAWGSFDSSGISENGKRKGQNFTIKDTKRESRTNTKDKKLSSVLE